MTRSLTLSALCPPIDGILPPLHHPITLPCGHTLSSQHIPIPSPAPLNLAPNLPAHEIAAAQKRQHEHRLSLWSGVMCPVPSCKRYSPTASSSGVVRDMTHLDLDPADLDAVAAAEEVTSGVAYYPPPLPAPPAYSAEPPVTDSSSPLLDVCVDKILGIVERETNRLDSSSTSFETRTEVESSSSSTSSPASPVARAPSKRRRNSLTHPRGRGVRDDGWGRELMGVLECDVCALMLYEPVTTPCQHVSLRRK